MYVDFSQDILFVQQCSSKFSIFCGGDKYYKNSYPLDEMSVYSRLSAMEVGQYDAEGHYLMNYIELCERFIEEKFPAAEIVVMAGSTACHSRTASSDIDLIIIGD